MRIVSKKGFSLVELMIVIGIIGIFFVAIQQLTQNTNLDQERTVRFAELIHDTIRDTRNDMVIGRGVLTGETTSEQTFMPTAQKSLVFTHSGFVLWYQRSGAAGISTEKTWKHPFIDHDPLYVIRDIEISSGALGSTGGIVWGAGWQSLDANTPLELVFYPQWRLSFSWVDPTARTYRITVGYKGFTRYVIGSAVTGNVEIRNNPTE